MFKRKIGLFIFAFVIGANAWAMPDVMPSDSEAIAKMAGNYQAMLQTVVSAAQKQQAESTQPPSQLYNQVMDLAGQANQELDKLK